MWWTDPNHPDVQAALTKPCPVCTALAGENCNSLTIVPLNRPVHLYWLEP